MKRYFKTATLVLVSMLFFSCSQTNNFKNQTASTILGNPKYLAICYSGYRGLSRTEVPTVSDIKEDLKILSAVGIKVLRTYHVQKYSEMENLLKAIRALKKEDKSFEMYVMLGAWIECKDAWTKNPDHNGENIADNTAEIEKAVVYANQYPDIIKIIAVGNEAMVHWATSYYVQPKTILKWVNYLQDLKSKNKLPKNLWITSSDNFASWGGADDSYHTEDLTKLIKAVDYVSMHTYPFQDTHYNPSFWIAPKADDSLNKIEKIKAAVQRATTYAISQYQSTSDYIKSLGIDKPIHIGETGWATDDNVLFGDSGSKAADEYKEKLYYDALRSWSNKHKISLFYFEAFDEQWKDATNPKGAENHFGLFNLQGQAKYVLWSAVDSNTFAGLKRGGNPITKTFNGDISNLIAQIAAPPSGNK